MLTWLHFIYDEYGHPLWQCLLALVANNHFVLAVHIHALSCSNRSHVTLTKLFILCG
jgi:hypothetical protein